MELCIWFENGTTAYFKDVDNISGVEIGVLEFTYFGVSSEKHKRARFFLEGIAGYSITTE